MNESLSKYYKSLIFEIFSLSNSHKKGVYRFKNHNEMNKQWENAEQIIIEKVQTFNKKAKK